MDAVTVARRPATSKPPALRRPARRTSSPGPDPYPRLAGYFGTSGELRLALSLAEAAAAFGVSKDFFNDHIAPHVRTMYIGSRRLVSVRELERFIDEHSTLMHRLDGSVW